MLRSFRPTTSVVREFGRKYEDTEAVFSHRFEQGGTYFVRISDYEKAGSKQHFYRMKVGGFPLVTSTYPLGVRRGESAEVSLKGFNLGAGKFTVEGEPSKQDESLVMFRPETDQGRSFNEVKLALGDHPEIESQGHNTAPEKAQTVDLPLTINGRIAESEKQGHYFRFKAKKDQAVLVDVNAARLGSKLDSVVDVLDAAGKPIEQASVRAVAVAKTDLFDHTSKQSRIRFEMSKDIDAGDYLMLGSEIMLVTRMPRQPDEGLALESFPPEISGRRTQGAVRMASFGTSTQAHAKGTPMYKVQIHPPGKKFPANGLPFVRLYYSNDDGRVPYGKDSFLKFKAPADGEYIVRIRDTHGRGGEQFSYRLALRPPGEDFRVFVNPKTPNVPQGERIPLTVTALRFDGFDGDINVSLAGLPQGVHAEDTVIPGGQVLTTVLLRADAGAEIGKSTPLKVKGVATIAGKEVTKWANPGDNPKFVSVVPPADLLISADKREVVLEPGQDAKITVSVTRKNGFGGRVPVEVLNMPPHTDTPEVRSQPHHGHRRKDRADFLGTRLAGRSAFGAKDLFVRFGGNGGPLPQPHLPANRSSSRSFPSRREPRTPGRAASDLIRRTAYLGSLMWPPNVALQCGVRILACRVAIPGDICGFRVSKGVALLRYSPRRPPGASPRR